MPRWRLCVALLIPEPVNSEIQGIRKAFGDSRIERIPPHITLVPPVNVNVENLAEALSVIRAAAAESAPLALRLGPITTFLPRNPVAKLDVGGEGIASLRQLRAAVSKAPLEREDVHEFVPHVTVKPQATTEQLEAIERATGDFEMAVEIKQVHLLREFEGRMWTPIADVQFGAPSVVGRGGFEIELTESQMIDPIAAQLLDGRVPQSDLAITARHEGDVVGVVAGVLCGDDVQLLALIVELEFRFRGIGSQLLKHFLAAAVSKNAKLAVLALESGEEELASFFDKFGFTGGVRPL